MADTPSPSTGHTQASDPLAGTGLGEGGVTNGTSVTASPNDLIARLIQARSEGTCSQFGLEQGCSMKDIMGKIIGDRESGWQATRKELCADVLAGTDQATVVQRAGLAEGTNLQCEAPKLEQAQASTPPTPTVSALDL